MIELFRSGLGNTNQKYLGVIWAVIAAVYLVVRFALTQELEALHPYASYIFELMLVALALCSGEIGSWKRVGPLRSLAVGGFATLIAGGAVYRFAGLKGIVIPFNLTGIEPVIFLVIVAPILEEAVFRFFLWKPIEIFTNRIVALFVATLLFSYSHFHAYWFYPAEIHPFIYYQSAYTLALGLAAGFFVWRYNALWGAVLIHFAFNLGFYLADVLK